jgi:TolB-like protein/DNA-binding winged helix-turn-helix (wHTH) protein/Tfp pilus assembly protein PilF
MASQSTKVLEPVRFGEDFEFDLGARRLSRGNRVLKVERIPLEIMVLLIERWGETVRRDEIVDRVWGKGVFLDTDNSIRGAIRKLRQVLKDNAETPRFIQTVTGRGYRFIAPIIAAEVDHGGAGTLAQPAAGPDVRPSLISQVENSSQSRGLRLEQERPSEMVAAEPDAGSHRASRTWHKLPLFVVVVVALAGVAYVTVVRNRPVRVLGPKIISIGVLPFKNLSGDPAQEYLADGMTEEIIGRLSMIRGLRVISRTSAMHFKDTQLSVPEIATALHADTLVEGSVMREGNRIRVHAQLIRAATDEHFWSETYDRELRDVFVLESDVAQSIAAKVEVSATRKEQARLMAAARPVTPEVFESFLKGAFTHDYSRAGVETSIANFEDAIRRDPSFAPAYVGLAAAYDQYGSPGIGGAPPDEVRPKVVSAIRKALELDPEIPIAHELLGNMYKEEWRWDDAELEYNRALELNPNDSSAHLGFAGWLLCEGRTDEALQWARRARELDPFGVTGTTMGWMLFQSRHYDEAIRELKSDLAVHPEAASTHWFLGYALIANGQAGEAIGVLEKALVLSKNSPAVMGLLVRAYSRAGKRAKALRLCHELERKQKERYVPAAALVHAYLGLGDNEQALVWLRRAYDEHSQILQFAKVHPFLDPLRNDPRFTDLVRRVGLD